MIIKFSDRAGGSTMTTTKSRICENLYERLGLSKRECGDIVDRFFEIIKKSLAHGDDVMLTGLGTLTVKHKNARKGRNPNTGEDMEIAERKVVTFSLSKVLKNEINDNRR
jgi:integration host factor subunit alpha